MIIVMKDLKKITFKVVSVYPKSSPSKSGYAVATFIKEKTGAFIPETDSAGVPLKDEKGNPIGHFGAPTVKRYGITISEDQYLGWLPRLMDVVTNETTGEESISPKEEQDLIYSSVAIYHPTANPLGNFDVIVSENTYKVNGVERNGLNRYIVTRDND